MKVIASPIVNGLLLLSPGVWKTYTGTLVSGNVAIPTDFQEVYDVVISQNTATPVAEGLGHTASGGDVTVKSSNGSSVIVVTLDVRGRH